MYSFFILDISIIFLIKQIWRHFDFGCVAFAMFDRCQSNFVIKEETFTINVTYVSDARRFLSTDIVLQLECSSTLAVDSVASFTIPI